MSMARIHVFLSCYFTWDPITKTGLVVVHLVEHLTFGRGDQGSKPPVVEHLTFGRGTGFKTTCGRASDFWSRGPGFKTTCGRASDFWSRDRVQNHLW